jgi:hypothetical protein
MRERKSSKERERTQKASQKIHINYRCMLLLLFMLPLLLINYISRAELSGRREREREEGKKLDNIRFSLWSEREQRSPRPAVEQTKQQENSFDEFMTT